MDRLSKPPIDIFAEQLARAGSTPFRLLRGLQACDKEDVLQSAVLMAWEQRDSFDPSKGSLSSFFYNFVKSAVRDFRRHAARHRALENTDELAASDDTVRAAAIEQARVKVLNKVDRRALEMLADGCSAAEIATRCGLTTEGVWALARRLKNAASEVVASEPSVTVPTGPRDPDEEREPSRIDRELQRLDFPPKTGAECCSSRCIRCAWFYGVREPKGRVIAAEVVSAEIRSAQTAVYRRKVEISAAMRGESVSVETTAASAA
jgi:RNA polymerase sigma factor (sigma-70 family)